MDNQTASINVGAQGYPFLLREIYDPPKRLYYKGTLPADTQILIAVVGSRKMTVYGKACLERLIPPLVQARIGIVSGLAYGIDTEALRLALAIGGYTCGIIGSGLDENAFYPKQNLTLANRMILSGGSVISEYSQGTPALPHHFAIRNRIIAGMCHATLIIEAAEKSGTLITASVALNEGREVFAVPHDIFNRTGKGTNMLIKNGANMVTDAQDILDILGIELREKKNKPTIHKDKNILEYVTNAPLHIDAIAKRANLTAQKAGAILSELEIQGVVKNIGGNNYIRIHG